MYSFERNDKSSFVYLSRVYDVFKGDDKTSPILSLVIGYDEIINQYFVCYLAEEPFESIYGHRFDDNIDTWKEVMNEFIMLFENIFEKTDIVEEKHYTEEEINKMPELTRDNLLYYTGSCDYDEIRELPVVIDEDDNVLNKVIEKEYLVPVYFEDDEIEMVEYSKDEFLDFIISNSCTESMYFIINFYEMNN